MVLSVIKYTKLQFFFVILNLQGHLNRFTGSKATAILMNGGILHCGGVASGRVCSLRSRLVSLLSSVFVREETYTLKCATLAHKFNTVFIILLTYWHLFIQIDKQHAWSTFILFTSLFVHAGCISFFEPLTILTNIYFPLLPQSFGSPSVNG